MKLDKLWLWVKSRVKYRCSLWHRKLLLLVLGRVTSRVELNFFMRWLVLSSWIGSTSLSHKPVSGHKMVKNINGPITFSLSICFKNGPFCFSIQVPYPTSFFFNTTLPSQFTIVAIFILALLLCNLDFFLISKLSYLSYFCLNLITLYPFFSHFFIYNFKYIVMDCWKLVTSIKSLVHSEYQK